MKKILLTTAYKPYGTKSPDHAPGVVPEVYHFRLTREQGIFSYRHHLNAFGLHAIAKNIPAETTVLEYPTWERFLKELDRGYDYVGFGSMVVNFKKLAKMARAVRERSPHSKIIIGGYCSHLDNLAKLVPLDYVCTGEGISFMRDLLGAPPEYQFQNPDIYSAAHSFMGVPMFGKKTPHIVIGLGCPYRCEFCSASHHFGGKYVKFLTTGAQIFAEMERMEKKFKNSSFGFTGDDNFVLDLNRAEELRERVAASGRHYEIFYFASAKRLQEFGPVKLAEMGTNIVWIGRESNQIEQKKVDDTDLAALVADLHRHGIKVILSTILLMEHHNRKNVQAEIDDHLRCKPDFSQFSIYSPMPGTPYYDRMKEENKINWTIPYETWHGLGPQWVFNPEFSPEESVALRDQAYKQEYRELGPGVMRVLDNNLTAWQNMRESESAVLRRRAAHIEASFPKYRPVLSAVAQLAPTPEMREMAREKLDRMEKATAPMSTPEKILAAGLTAFGLKEKAKQAAFGDLIQPPTIVTHYRG